MWVKFILQLHVLLLREFQVQFPAGAFLCGVCNILPVYAWVLSGYSGFLPPSKNMHVRLIGESKLSPGVSLNVHGCVSYLSLCGPKID